MRKETHIFLRHIEVNHVGGAVVRYLTQESGEFRHFDIRAEAFFALDVSGYVQLVVGAFLRKYRSPRIKTAYSLSFQLCRAQILEHHIQLRKGIDYDSTRQESSTQIAPCPLLNVTDCEKQVCSPL